MNYDMYDLTGEPFENRESIEVLYNGTKYTLPFSEANDSIYYGATYDDDSGEFDFSTYPLSINVDDVLYLHVPVDTPLPITISAGCTVTVEPVWEKVGSGGSEPSGDGYEINNPVLTLNISNDDVEGHYNRFFVDNNGYLSYENLEYENGDSTVKTIVFGSSDGEGGYDFYYETGMRTQDISSTSNLVNCTLSGSSVIITDPTQDASIDIVLILDI